MDYREVNLREDGSSRLVAYLLNPEVSYRCAKRRPCVIVCPGGGYVLRATKEQEASAMRFAGAGYHTVVLQYPVYFAERPEPGHEPVINEDAHFPTQLEDLMRAMMWVHEHASSHAIDIERIYVLGFSAGAHLAGTLAERWDDPEMLARIPGADSRLTKPRGVIMSYPMVDARAVLRRDPETIPESIAWQLPYFERAMLGAAPTEEEGFDHLDLVAHVRADMPRMFVWTTGGDQVAPPEAICRFAARALEVGVPCELHLFEDGPHGLALADESTAAVPADVDSHVAQWVPMALAWLDKDRSGLGTER